VFTVVGSLLHKAYRDRGLSPGFSFGRRNCTHDCVPALFSALTARKKA